MALVGIDGLAGAASNKGTLTLVTQSSLHNFTFERRNHL